MTKKKKRTKSRHLNLKAVFCLILLVVLVVFLVIGFRYRSAQKPVQQESTPVTITIDSGVSARNALAQLQDAGVIRDGTMAYLYARQHDLTAIKAGIYNLDASWDLNTILVTLNDPTAAIVDQVTVTIVEGDWAKDVANKIGAATNVSSDDLIAKWNDKDYVRSLMSDYPFLTEDVFNSDTRCLLEGYLFPNTYNFYPETDADTITRTLLNGQLTVYNELKDQMSASSLTIHQIYTLASIIQYEASTPEDMAKVAQVFYNRLAIDMPLQSSVTVCYAIDLNRDTDSWKACEVNSDYDSPYNTYLHTGLPPGPILNPGRDALNAVLNPDTSMDGYYYFMADVTTGKIYYAKTLEEHNANVKKYDQVN
ncbi:endolytic transglycosylase MltG [Galactobacillus timonensis]|uniref:endolytic transglycosylase MltG n=1 Tax=Galactobacillus timonensis TaxID=2041840 RepID=UPI000C84CAEE|nr:endolytic transglycosylase MltG [Galactobacillus timonensis]